MLRKFLFSEEYGRNVIWLMLSGFFSRINAYENRFGQIILPENHYLYNLDNEIKNEEHLQYDNLHFIVLDGPVQHINDIRISRLKKDINIHYVGKFDNYWKKIKNAQPLFQNDNLEYFSQIIEIKKKYPNFFKKYFFKQFLTTLSGINKIKLFSNHCFKSQKYVYYGYIRPTDNHIKFFRKFINVSSTKLNNFFKGNSSLENLKSNIKEICHLKEALILNTTEDKFPYVNEIILFIVRNIICNYLRDKKNFIIYDGLGGKNNFNAYEMFFGNHHVYLDFGSKVGYDKVYPRSALLDINNRRSVRFICEEKFFNFEYSDSYSYLDSKIDEFLSQLKFD